VIALPISEDAPTVANLGAPLLKLEVELVGPDRFCLAVVDQGVDLDHCRLPADRASWILVDLERWILVDGQVAAEWFREACFRSSVAVQVLQQPVAAE
jgi:hypothetical protein